MPSPNEAKEKAPPRKKSPTPTRELNRKRREIKGAANEKISTNISHSQDFLRYPHTAIPVWPHQGRS